MTIFTVAKIQFLQFPKWPKINFCTGKKFKIAKSAIFIALFFHFLPTMKGEINSNHVPHYIITQCSVFYYRKRKWLPLRWTLLLFKYTVRITFCYLVKGPNMFSPVVWGSDLRQALKIQEFYFWFWKIIESEINFQNKVHSLVNFWGCSEVRCSS